MGRRSPSMLSMSAPPASPAPRSCGVCGDLLPEGAERCDTCGGAVGSRDAVPPLTGALLSLVAGAVLTTALCVVAAIVAAVTVPTGVRLQLGANEAAAIEALRALARAQQRFREEDLDRDGEQDYGELAELAAAGLIGADLASGVQQGYLFEAAPAELAPARAWMAVASPLLEGRTGQRHFAINHHGAVVYTWRPITLDVAQAELPGDTVPVGAD